MQELISGKIILKNYISIEDNVCPLGVKDDSWEVFRWIKMLLGL